MVKRLCEESHIHILDKKDPQRLVTNTYCRFVGARLEGNKSHVNVRIVTPVRGLFVLNAT
jgi:hypothetical protein